MNDRKELNMKTLPTAPVLDIRPNPTYPGAVILVVGCPYCGKRHTHGEPRGLRADGDYGHRAAHCTSSNNGYNIRKEAV